MDFIEILIKIHKLLQEDAFEIVVCKMWAILFQPECVIAMEAAIVHGCSHLVFAYRPIGGHIGVGWADN